MSSPGLTEIEMHSGVYVELADPQPETIRLEDIAFSLANIARYGGHVPFYSVAQHAVLVTRRLRKQGETNAVQLAGLHHDDPEAYIGDVPKPLKPLLPELKHLNHKFELVIKKALDIEGANFEHPSIKAADTWSLSYEAYWLMQSKGAAWPSAGVYTPGEYGDPEQFVNWAPHAAESLFLAEHKTLTEQCKT